MKINPSNQSSGSLLLSQAIDYISLPWFPRHLVSFAGWQPLYWSFNSFLDVYYLFTSYGLECICIRRVLLLPDIVGKLRPPKHPKAFRWSIGCQGAGDSGAPFAFCVLLQLWVYRASFPVVCLHWLLSWFLLFHFPLGPPVFPLNHRKWGDLGLSQCVAINYLTAVWKRSLRYLLGSHRVRECPRCNGSLSSPPPLGRQPCPNLLELWICALSQALWWPSSSLQPAL